METTSISPDKLLIVDDNSKNIQMAASILKKYSLAFAKTGQNAINQALSTSFDLILLDIMMPEMDGFAVCRILKSHPRTAQIPIIFLTAKTDTDTIVKGFEHGAVDYIQKPFSPLELIARVNNQLKLAHALKSAREANATKDRFFSIIAHDLKNPFNTMIGFSDMLLRYYDELGDAKRKNYITQIHDSAKLTFSLLENLLTWSRMQLNKIELNFTEIELNAIVKQNIDLLKAHATSKSIALSMHITDGTLIFADQNTITMVIRNLLSNAIKYTKPHGSVSISSQTFPFYEEIAVSDTGIGLTPGKIQKLFSVDQLTSTLGTADEQGTGLGLILCHEFIRKNGGRIRVESEPGKGSCFKFSVPKKNCTTDRLEPS